MSIRVTSKSIEEAKQRLKLALEHVEKAAQAQLSLLERELLEAKAATLNHESELQELQQVYTREKAAHEHAEHLLTEIKPRLEEMSSEILTILKNAGAR